jgi:hypothetical protein
MNVDAAAAAHQIAQQRAAQPVAPALAPRLADDDAGDVALAGEVQQRLGDRVVDEGHDLGAQRLREPQGLREPAALGRAGERERRRLDAHGEPFGAQTGGDASRRADQSGAAGTRTHADQQALRRRPQGRYAVLAAIGLHVAVDALGHAPQRQLAQRQQVALAKEGVGGPPGVLRQIDPALAQALEQRVGREVDELDLVGAIEDRVRDGLAHAHPGDLGDHVVERLEVLHVQCRVHVDAGREQLEHVLPALRMARARGVRVRQLVDQQQPRTARERGVEVQLHQRDAAMLEPLPRQRGQADQQGAGLVATVGLDQADDHVEALGLGPPGRLEHGVGLADPGRGAEEDLEVPARTLRARRHFQQRLGVGAGELIGAAHRGPDRGPG